MNRPRKVQRYCRNCKKRFRADDPKIKGTPGTPDAQCPACGMKGTLSAPRQFNLMFKTFMGPVEEQAADLRVVEVVLPVGGGGSRGVVRERHLARLVVDEELGPVAALWASEASIYGRFGYGPAVDVSAPGSSVLTTNCIASNSAAINVRPIAEFLSIFSL